jgi:hypothetical protein
LKAIICLVYLRITPLDSVESSFGTESLKL